MAKVNWSLIMGSIIVILLLFTIIYEDGLIRADPYSLDRGLEYIIGDKVFKAEHPIKPNSIDKLGTDPLGRNLLSLLIKGTKVTVGIAFISTIIRLFIWVLTSLIIKEKERKFNNRIFYVLSIVSNIFIAYIILSQPYFSDLELSNAILAFGLVLGILGWERMHDNKEKLTIKANFPYILINLFREVGITLFILAVLGFLGITIGVNKYSTISTNWGIIPNYNPEWGGILAIAKQAIDLKAYWLVVGPSIFFVISIIGFLLVSKGLRNNIKNYGTIVSKGMRKIGNFLSPKQYIIDIKRFSWNKSRVIAKSIVIIIIFLWIAPSTNAGNGYYEIDGKRALKDLEKIHEIQEQNGINSVETKQKVGEYIVDELEKMYRLFPVFDDEYVQDIIYEQSKGETNKKELVEGENIAGYIWGRNSNNPLVLVTNYGSDLHENGVSVATLLELARSLSEKNNQNMASRTIVFLFVDGSLNNGLGVYNAIGNKNIDINSFYIYLNYLGLEDSNKLYMDTSSVSSAYKRHYNNIKNIKEVAKEVKIPIKQDYFDNMFIDVETFTENKVSGLAISGIGKVEYSRYVKLNEQDKNDINGINSKIVADQIQFIMNIVEKYAWSDKYWLGDSY